ncbi:hypothetical protein LL999_23080 [Burkholderia ambifaria]|uniref:hypothetical protein n=1 Tax=Burkholderia ambifaria TaxID=152480 RepID=UPI001E5B71B5|nr:hypothetical protein [Burkholderia ambifaria]UEP23132.1 hypothetical protein LL999_23080 [Burkholderia ambifaria]
MNCKPGDLAIMVTSGIKENIGKIFEVLGPASHETTFFGHFSWRVRASSPALDNAGEFTLVGTAFDAHLRPVSGLPITDDIKDEVTA